jgi:hypothetical protein
MGTANETRSRHDQPRSAVTSQNGAISRTGHSLPAGVAGRGWTPLPGPRESFGRDSSARVSPKPKRRPVLVDLNRGLSCQRLGPISGRFRLDSIQRKGSSQAALLVQRPRWSQPCPPALPGPPDFRTPLSGWRCTLHAIVARAVVVAAPPAIGGSNCCDDH